MGYDLDKLIGTVEIDGKRVCSFRKLIGLSTAELADEALIGPSTIEKWEAHGVTRAKVDTVRDVAAVLKTSLRELLTARFLASLENPERVQEPEPEPEHPRAASGTGKCQLLPDLADFLGREEEMKAMTSRLSRRQAGATILLWGMGGVGKTTLAMRAAHRLRNHYVDGQLYLDLCGVSEMPITTAKAMEHFLRTVNSDFHAVPDDTRLSNLYRTHFADQKCLFVLDNALNEEQVKSLIAGGGNSFIITSRRLLNIDGVDPMEIRVFSTDQSRQFLQSIVETSRGSVHELDTIAALCGHLPLALRVAGHFLRNKAGWTAKQLISALNQERLRWLKSGDDPSKNVEVVLKLSATQLVRDNLRLATRWHLLSLLGSDFDAAAARAAWSRTSELDVLADLSDLVERSLLLYDADSGRYRMHDLMRPIALGLFK